MINEEYATFKDYQFIELALAQTEYDVAKNHFEHCDLEFAESAILKLRAAEQKLTYLLKERMVSGVEQKSNHIGNSDNLFHRLYRTWRQKQSGYNAKV